MKKILLINVLGGLLLFLGVSSAAAVDLAPYFNLGGSKILVFEEYDNPGTGWVYDETYAELRLPLGGGLIGLLELDAPAFTPDNLDIYQKQVGGYHCLGELDFGEGDWKLFSPASGPLDGKMSVGQTIHLSFTRFSSDEPPTPITVDYTLTKAGFSHTTPAGTFNDCVQIDLKVSEGGTVVGTGQWILARGIGHVSRFAQESGWAGLAERATLVRVF